MSGVTSVIRWLTVDLKTYFWSFYFICYFLGGTASEKRTAFTGTSIEAHDSKAVEIFSTAKATEVILQPPIESHCPSESAVVNDSGMTDNDGTSTESTRRDTVTVAVDMESDMLE